MDVVIFRVHVSLGDIKRLLSDHGCSCGVFPWAAFQEQVEGLALFPPKILVVASRPGHAVPDTGGSGGFGPV